MKDALIILGVGVAVYGALGYYSESQLNAALASCGAGTPLANCPAAQAVQAKWALFLPKAVSL
jgi:hypothetical protein